jgi:YqjK-like protein
VNRAEQLAARRVELLLKGTQQRDHLIEQHEAIAARLKGVDRGIEILRRVIEHPFVVIGAIATIVTVGPFKVLRWIGTGALWFRIARNANHYFKFLGDAAPDRPRDDG